MVKQKEHGVARSERGFSLVEMCVVVVVLIVVVSYSVLGIRSAQVRFRQSGAAATLAAYIEKARADSIRRHAGSGTESRIQITGGTAYTVALDFNYDGATETRTITLPPGVAFPYDAANPPAAMVFDWRGRVADVSGALPLRSTGHADIAINLSNSGDVAVNGNFVTPTPSTVTTISSDINPQAALTPTPTP